MPSADVLPWHPDNNDPGYHNRECRIKRVRVDTLKFTSDIYPVAPAKEIQQVFAANDDDIPDHDIPTVINHLDTGILHNYWSDGADIITVNAVKIDKDDPTVIKGQFDSSNDAIVTNLLIYLHNYKQYTTKFKCPVKLTGAIGTKDIHPLDEEFLHLPTPTPFVFLAV